MREIRSAKQLILILEVTSPEQRDVPDHRAQCPDLVCHGRRGGELLPRGLETGPAGGA